MNPVIGRPAAPICNPAQFRPKQFSALLRAARRRLPPPGGFGSQRRIGLTQEQAAHLLGMDVRHYQNLEHGRLRRIEPALLERIVAALNLSPAEREVLYRLGADHPPPWPAWADRDMNKMRELIDFLPGLPAVVTNMAFDILLWNEHVAQWLVDPASIEPRWRNAILWMFCPQARDALPGIEREYPDLVGRVRLAYLSDGGRDLELADVVERLLAIPTAADLWDSGVLALEPVIQSLVVHHPQLGDQEVRTLNTVIPQQGLRLMTFTPIGQPGALHTDAKAPRTRAPHGPGRTPALATAGRTQRP